MPPNPQTPEEAISLPWLRTLTPQAFVIHLHAVAPTALGILAGILGACGECFPSSRAHLRLPTDEAMMAAHVVALHPEMVLVEDSEELKTAADELVKRFDRLMAEGGARNRVRTQERCKAFSEQVGVFEPMYAAWKARRGPTLLAHVRAKLGHLLSGVLGHPVGDDQTLAAAVLAQVEPELESLRLFLFYLPDGQDVVWEFGPAFEQALAPHRALCAMGMVVE